ncbi:MAG: pilus assembly protein [Acetivibrio sp.]
MLILGEKRKGSFTVEAVFVFPMVLFLILAFLYLGFILHDRVCLQTISEQVGREAVEKLRNHENFEMLIKNMEEQAERKLCITDIEELKIHNGVFYMEISYFENVRIRGIHFFHLFQKERKEKKIKVPIYNPMKIVRSYETGEKNESGV